MNNEEKKKELKEELKKIFGLNTPDAWKASTKDEKSLISLLKKKYGIKSKEKPTFEMIDVIANDIVEGENIELYAWIKYCLMEPEDLMHIQNIVTPQIIASLNVVFKFKNRGRLYPIYI